MGRAPLHLPPLESFSGATTAYVDAAVAPKAPIASPTFTGVPKAPTAPVGTATTQLATTSFVNMAVPVGFMGYWPSAVAPPGWHLCDGTVHGSAALEAFLQSTTTPNLRDMFVVVAGNTYAVGDTGGAGSVTLTAAQSGVAAHTHAATAGDQSADHTHVVNPAAFTSGAASNTHTHYSTPAAATTSSDTHSHNVIVNEGISADGVDGSYVDTVSESQSNTRTVGTTSSDAHTHTVTVAPFTTGTNNVGHTHQVDVPATTSAGASANHSHPITVSAAASSAASEAHENRPPYYALTMIIKK